MGTLGLTALILGVPERVVLAIESHLGLVATMLAVGTDQFPGALVDIIVENIGSHRTGQQTIGRAIGLDGAGINMGNQRGVFLILATIDTVIDLGILGGGGHLDTSIGQTLHLYKFADRELVTSEGRCLM